MNLYVSQALSAHRRGRFLSGLLGATPIAQAVPADAGLLFMPGEAFQALGDGQTDLLSWARQPGCVLLLLPPYQQGQVGLGLDWSIRYASAPLTALASTAASGESIAAILADEVLYCLDGRDGGNGGNALDVAHLWADQSSNTRYWRAHTNSGLVAATVLPLWSISVLDHAALVRAWLGWFEKQCGKVALAAADPAQPPTACALSAHDHTVMVCCHGFQVATASGLLAAIGNSPIPLIDLACFDLPASFARLEEHGFVDAQGLTAQGLHYLQSTAYWAFAERLKEIA